MAQAKKAGRAVAVLALVVGLAALAAVLLAGPGSRMGWWSYRTALGTVLVWAAYGGLAAAVLSLIALILGGRRGLAALALVLSLAAFLPPFLFRRTAQSVPPIHDVTTDTENPPPFVAVLEQRAGAANPAEYGGAEVAAQQKKGYPDLRPATLADPPPRAFERALEAARGQGWEIVAAVPAEGRIEATDTTRWFGFKDDVVVRVKPEGTGSRVDVRSLSRVGRSDVGKNASRIRAYLSALGELTTMFGETGARRCRDDFPSLARHQGGRPLAYLDGPAGTQVPGAVIEAISGYYRSCNANTHGQFVTSQESDALIASTREAVAAFLGAPSGKTISFGQNMTTLCYSLARALSRELQPGDEVVITQLDHEANRGPWLSLRERGATVHEVRLRPDGRLDYDDMAAKIGKRTRIVAMGLSSNALGTVNDAALARSLSRAVGARLVLDAVHYAPHFPVDVTALDTDFLLCSAYKFYGPHVGLLYARPGLLDSIDPDRLRTQEQTAPERFETGTLNHAALAGVKAAIEYIAAWGDGVTLRERVVSAVSAIAAHEHALGRRYDEEVRRITGVQRWGTSFDEGPRAPTVSITIDGVDAEAAARRLGQSGILVWDGNFYALRAIEVLGLLERGGVLRTGFSMYNTSDEVDRLLAGVAEIARRRA